MNPFQVWLILTAGSGFLSIRSLSAAPRLSAETSVHKTPYGLFTAVMSVSPGDKGRSGLRFNPGRFDQAKSAS